MNKALTSIGVAAVCIANAFGRDAQLVIDNDRVSVWDVTWTKGQTNPARGHDRDVVTMWIAGAKARQAFFTAKNDGPAAKGRADEGARSLLVELKDHPVPPLENKTGYPLAFPRPHVKKLLENDRVIVWSYRWNPGEPTPMHFHDKDVVVVYLEPTALTSTTVDGAKTLNEYKAYDVRFNKRDRAHTELLERGTGSAMMMELK
jgi:predicted metal-dependent enzyme (double-stranded beta helix superfamily)